MCVYLWFLFAFLSSQRNSILSCGDDRRMSFLKNGPCLSWKPDFSQVVQPPPAVFHSVGSSLKSMDSCLQCTWVLNARDVSVVFISRRSWWGVRTETQSLHAGSWGSFLCFLLELRQRSWSIWSFLLSAVLSAVLWTRVQVYPRAGILFHVLKTSLLFIMMCSPVRWTQWTGVCQGLYFSSTYLWGQTSNFGNSL